MRRAYLMATVTFLVGLTACDRMWGPDPRVAARGRAAALAPVTPLEFATNLECVVDGGPQSTPCPNLLPANWMALKNKDLDTLMTRVRSLLPQNGTVSRNRVASSDCANGPAPAADSVLVGYDVPVEAMKRFPTTGTKGRQLVIGVMADFSGNKPCWSQKYSVTNKLTGGKRLMTLLTVETDSGTSVRGVDRTVGRWHAWSVIAKGRDTSVMNTSSGAYVSCGHSHYQTDTLVTHAFVDCSTISSLMLKAKELAPNREQSAVTAEFNRLLRNYRDGKAPDGMRFLGGSDPAWARCGNLGCCTAA